MSTRGIGDAIVYHRDGDFDIHVIRTAWVDLIGDATRVEYEIAIVHAPSRRVILRTICSPQLEDNEEMD